MLPLSIAMIVENDDKDGDFFGFLYHEYHREVYRISMKIVKNSLDAEDVTQTTFLKIYRSIEKFRDLPPTEIAPLIVVYSRNTAKDFMRKKQRQVETVDMQYDGEDASLEHDFVAPDAEPEKLLIDKERTNTLAQYIDALPEKQRHVILLRYRYGLSEKETADAMSMSETAVSSCLLRAKKTLRKEMGGKL